MTIYPINKTCSHCHCSKPLEEFPISIRHSSGRRNKCKQCTNAYDREYNKTPKRQEIRGLLCYKCNTALGLFEDSAVVLLKAAGYIFTNISLPKVS